MTSQPSLLRRLDHQGMLPLAIRAFLGIYFLWTGFTKVLDPQLFLKGIKEYNIMPLDPPIFMNLTAVALPWLEVICGVALILGLWRRGAAAWLAVMLAIFTPAIFLRALQVMAIENISFFTVAFDCGCGTGLEITWIKLLKNTGLFALSALTLMSQSNWLAIDAILAKWKAGQASAQDPAIGGTTQLATEPG